MDQACCPSAAANFKQPGHTPSGDALAGEGSPGGPGLGKLVQPVAPWASGHGFSSAPSSAWKSGPSRWEDRSPSIDGSAVKRDCLRAGPASPLSEAALAPQTAGREVSQTLYPWEAAGTPGHSQRGERVEGGQTGGRGLLELTVPTSAACEVGLSPTFLVEHPGTAGWQAALTPGHRRAPLVAVRSQSWRWALWVSVMGTPRAPNRACGQPGHELLWEAALPPTCLPRALPACAGHLKEGASGGGGDALMGTPRSPSAVPGGRGPAVSDLRDSSVLLPQPRLPPKGVSSRRPQPAPCHRP